MRSIVNSRAARATRAVGLFGVVAALLTATPAAGQHSSATAFVSYELREINYVALSGDPQPLPLAAAGTLSTRETVDHGTTWGMATNQPGCKITALLDAQLPAGVALGLDLEAPAGASSLGPVPLGTTARDVVITSGPVQAADLGITYRLTPTDRAAVLPPRSARTVIFTILAAT